MPLNFSSITENDFSSGIDQFSAENEILQTFVYRARNVDIKERRLTKRPGNQSYAGSLPIRVESIRYIDDTPDQIEFQLNTSFDLSASRDVPIVVYGKTSNTACADFPANTDTVQYYSHITTDPRKSLTGTTTTVSDNGFPDTDFIVGVTESLSPLNKNNNRFYVDGLQINKTTFAVDLDYTLVTDPMSVFIYYKDTTTAGGSIYNTSFTGTTISIVAGTHGLNTYNIIPVIYKDETTEWSQVYPDTLTISSIGTVTITFSESGTYKVVLISVPQTQAREVILAADGTLTISNQTNPFIFYSAYRLNGTTFELAEIDDISYDEATNTFTVSFNGIYTSESIAFYYDYGNVQTSVLRVTPHNNISSEQQDTNPQMTIWGIQHAVTGIYGQFKVAREGWVNHLDSYRSAGESRLVAGLGGNLCAAHEYSEVATQYDYGFGYSNARNRLDADTTVSPLFHSSAPSPARTRGYILSSSILGNWAPLTQITYMTSGPYSGSVELMLSVPSVSILDSAGSPTIISSVVSTVANLMDQIQIDQVGYAVHKGLFPITAATQPDANTICIYVQNDSVSSSDYDEVDVGGLAGVFTDQLPMQSTNYFLPADQLLSSSIPDSTIYTVLSGTSDTIVVNGVTDTVKYPGGLRLTASRTSSVLPIRTILNVAYVDNFVAGDVLSFADIDRLLEIIAVNTNDDITVSINGDGATATVTLTGAETNFIYPGNTYNLVNSGVYSGTITVTEVTNQTEFTFDSSETDTVLGTLQGKTIQIDENLEWSDLSDDSITLFTARRWIPIEIPQDQFDLTPKYDIYQFDSGLYSYRDFIRSTMVSDTMFLTNNSDSVLKYDGTNIYRAGLPRWQAGVFLGVQSGTGITVPTSTVALASPFWTVNESRFKVGTGDESSFEVGDRIHNSVDGLNYTVTGINTTTHEVIVDRPITTAASAGNLTFISTYRYYYRLNAVDANNNVIASAAVGQDDFRVEIGQSSSLKHRLIGFPPWDIYDYDRLEVEIYRTKANTAAPFFKVVTLPMSWNNNTGYIDYTDTADDLTLIQLDNVTSALLGAELGTGWSDPLRGKYISSLGNKLAMANLTDYPKASIVLDGTGATFTNLNGKKFQFDRTFGTNTVTDNVDTQIFEFKTTSINLSAITESSSTITITPASGTYTVGDWVYLYHSTQPANPHMALTGWFQIASGAGPYVINNNHTTDGAATKPDKMVVATNHANIPVFLGNDYNYQFINAQAIGSRDEKNIAMNRLANAINCAQRLAVADPFIIGNSDGSYGNGQLVLTQPKITEDWFWIVLPTAITDTQVYVHDVARAASAYVQAKEILYPSRLIVSYENYPEIFDSPTAVLPKDSDSVIDVNSADGQEITGIIPFFGDSTFGARQQANILVVFKENSIYAVDLDQKDQGLPPVQKLTTNGLGCQVPFSIAYTKQGIMFANFSGIYRLRRDLSIEYIGKRLERPWLKEINRDQFDVMHGHHYADGKMYKLSIVASGDTEPSEVFVYHHTPEDDASFGGKPGGWTTYDSHNAVGWANLNSDAFWASTDGRVLVLRKNGSEDDFRDRHSAIEAEIVTRAMDFGADGIRKVFDAVTTHYRAETQTDGIELNYALDLQDEFHSTDPFQVNYTANPSGLGDVVNRSVVSIKSSLGRRKGLYLQLQYLNSNIDEPLDVAGINFKVAGLTDAGILQAKDTEDT